MTEHEALEAIAAQPLLDEFNCEQKRAMHQFMLGWRCYEALIKIAREVIGERSDEGPPAGGDDQEAG